MIECYYDTQQKIIAWYLRIMRARFIIRARKWNLFAIFKKTKVSRRLTRRATQVAYTERFEVIFHLI